jgi:hypothetical protein
MYQGHWLKRVPKIQAAEPANGLDKSFRPQNPEAVYNSLGAVEVLMASPVENKKFSACLPNASVVNLMR